MTTKHTETHFVFYLSDGSKHSVGKYIDTFGENGELTWEGVHTEQEAINLLLENGCTIEDLQ